MSLFDQQHRPPLSARLRPRTLDDFVGQEQLLGPGSLLRAMIERDQLVSIILYGPPGTGKTTLARIVAARTQAEFVALNAVNSGTPEIKRVCADAAALLHHQGRRTLVFIDEIHRFNKLQQDALLPEVEAGRIVLIGASTQNPSFALVPALMSRTSLFELQPLDDRAIDQLIERGLAELGAQMNQECRTALIALCSGDGRRALNVLESAAIIAPSQPPQIDIALLEQAAGRKVPRYDRDGDQHYDCISAFIKSVRGSDPDAAVYYLALMLEAGEDPLFIARRLAILAAEDIGNANPNGLSQAAATLEIVRSIGMPEARIPLAQTTIYLALSPKSNAAYLAIDTALADVRKRPILEVPLHLRNLKLRTGEASYHYPHDHGGYVAQRYLSEDRQYYQPTRNGYEARMSEWWDQLRQQLQRPEADS